MILSSFLFAFMPAGTIIVYVILILVLLIFSALISGSEVAFFSLGPTEKDLLKSEDSRNGNLALKLLEKPQELLATILIVNNFLNVGIVIFSSSLLNKLFHDTGSSTFHFILEVLSITFMILMIGEVIPKVYATKNGLLFAKLMAFPLRSLSSIPPFSWLKSFLVNGTKIIQMSDIGLVEITRQREERNIYDMFTKKCFICQGLGCKRSEKLHNKLPNYFIELTSIFGIFSIKSSLIIVDIK
jgi:CBS domain containing-hemolysin-like protein